MSLPKRLVAVLPKATARAWEMIAPAVPAFAYLAGGTAIAVHIGQRESRDLDFFTTRPFDPADLRGALADRGGFEPAQTAAGRLNGLFEDTKVQFLDASDQRVLEPTPRVGGIRVAGLGDLLATKLKVIADRGELRDYFDIWRIEGAGRRAEEGISLFLARYRPTDPDAAVDAIVRGLGYFGDVADDPFLPAPRAAIEAYWKGRQPEIVAHLDRHALAHMSHPPADEAAIAEALTRAVTGSGRPPNPSAASALCRAWMPLARTGCALRKGHGGHHRSVR
ncbi:MAG: nucleotidyl transferase AbiEii/AbiGii toxin family protein [Acidimicrobiales bacterium]